MSSVRTAVVFGVSLAIGCAGGGEGRGSTAATLGDGDGTGSSTDAGTAGGSGTNDGTSVGDPSGTGTGPGADGSTGGSDGPAAGCDEDPAACTAWILPSGSAMWTAEALDADSPLAPEGGVQAAFDIESELEGFVLTDDRVHIVDLAGRQWVRVEDRADILPDLGDDVIVSAYSIPAYWGDGVVEGVTFVSATTAYIYGYDIAQQVFDFDFATTDFGEGWAARQAPVPAQIRAGWLDVTNADGWITGNPMDLCRMGSSRVVPYAAFITSDQVHIQETGVCFEFFDPVGLVAFPPLGMPGAPAGIDVGGMLYNETMGLWAFR